MPSSIYQQSLITLRVINTILIQLHINKTKHSYVSSIQLVGNIVHIMKFTFYLLIEREHNTRFDSQQEKESVY